MAQSPRELTTAGRAGRLAARVRSAARRPVLSGVSSVGDVALAAAVTIAAVVTAIDGYLHVSNSPMRVLPGVTYVIGPPAPHPHLPAMLSWALLGVVLTTAPLAFRRTYPTSAFGVILAASIATGSYATAITVAAAIFAAYCAVAYSKYRRTTLLALLAAAIIIAVAYPEATAQVPERVWDEFVGDSRVTCAGLDGLSAHRCQMPGQAAPVWLRGCCQISSQRPLACWHRRARMPAAPA